MMSNWTAASSDCSRPANNYVRVNTVDLYTPNARFTPERLGYQVLTLFGKLGYSPILEWLDDHGLASCPMVAVYRNAKEMVTRRFGIEDSARSDAIRDEEPSATVQELMDALRHYHRSRVVTPTNCPGGVGSRVALISTYRAHDLKRAFKRISRLSSAPGLGVWFG